jgi:hypothetical protein
MCVCHLELHLEGIVIDFGHGYTVDRISGAIDIVVAQPVSGQVITILRAGSYQQRYHHREKERLFHGGIFCF